MRFQVRSLTLLSGLRIWHCRELWCKVQTQLGSGIAVAVVQASSCSSNQTPSLGTSICRDCGPKKPKNKKTKQNKKTAYLTCTNCLKYNSTRPVCTILRHFKLSNGPSKVQQMDFIQLSPSHGYIFQSWSVCLRIGLSLPLQISSSCLKFL